MRKSILFLGIFFISFSAKSQNWDPKFLTSLKEYFFVPIKFENFGDWIAGIENDSSLVFKKKEFTIVNDSINLYFKIAKPGFPSPIKNSALSLVIIANTRQHNHQEIRRGPGSLGFNNLPTQKVTTLNIGVSLSFDSTNEGKLLAANTMNELEKEFRGYFTEKKVIKANKNFQKRKHHPEVEKMIIFSLKDSPALSFWLTNSTFPDKNEVMIYVAYNLN